MKTKTKIMVIIAYAIALCLSLILVKNVSAKMITKEVTEIHGMKLVKVCVDGRMWLMTISASGETSELKPLFIAREIPKTCLDW